MPKLKADQWKVLGPYLEEVLGLAEEERPDWLARLRAENPSLAEQLDALLVNHRTLAQEGFLERRLVEFPGARTLAGQSLGMYKLVAQIGQGGMSSVWLGERSDGRFERKVAVKLLNISLMGRIEEARFIREGKILAALRHPYIADLIDAGVSQAGQPYLVIEYVEGDRLDQYCDSHRLDLQQRIRLFLQVLEAVGQAHANLVVHRDLKPSNILVRKDGQVKLLDFGIAKLLEGEGTEGRSMQLTSASGRAMTPEYAAPEQLQGKVITTATDVYSLGVLLYVLLTGLHPAGDGPHFPADLVKAIVDTEPLRPSDVVAPDRRDQEGVSLNAASRASTADKLRRSLRGDLDTIILKALKKEPSERYSSVTSFAEDLRRYLKEEPISVRADTFAYRAAKFVRRNNVAVALASLSIVAIVIGGGAAIVQSRIAQMQYKLALHQLARAEHIAEMNELLLSDVAPSGKPLTLDQLLEREQHIVEREPFSDAVNHVDMLISIGHQYSGQDENEKALHVLDEAYQFSRKLSDPLIRAKSSCAMAEALMPIGELVRAESFFQEGIRELRDDPRSATERAFCFLHGSEIAYRNGNSREALVRARVADQAAGEVTVRPNLQEFEALNNLAGVLGHAGQFVEANEKFEQASALMTRLGYDDTQKSVKLFNDWALTLTYAGQPLKAEKIFRRAIDISRADQSEDAVPPTLLHNYAGALRDLGRFQEADSYAERASVKAVQAGEEILVDQIDLLRARIFLDLHDLSHSEKISTQLEARMRKKLPPKHYAFAILASYQSQLALAQGNISKALRLVNRAVAIAESSMRSFGPSATYLPSLLTVRANLALQDRHPEQAAEDAQKAISLLKGFLPPAMHSSKLGLAYLALAHSMDAQGKASEAKDAFRIASEQLQDTLGPDHPETRSAQR